MTIQEYRFVGTSNWEWDFYTKDFLNRQVLTPRSQCMVINIAVNIYNILIFIFEFSKKVLRR